MNVNAACGAGAKLFPRARSGTLNARFQSHTVVLDASVERQLWSKGAERIGALTSRPPIDR